LDERFVKLSLIELSVCADMIPLASAFGRPFRNDMQNKVWRERHSSEQSCGRLESLLLYCCTLLNLMSTLSAENVTGADFRAIGVWSMWVLGG
jgi:hypothetical protein